jgi:hypothetical protein
MNALATASVDGASPVVIGLEEGTYAADAIDPDPLFVDVTLKGGYTPGTNCDDNQRHSGAQGTRLVIAPSGWFGLFNDFSADIVIRLGSLTIVGGQGVSIHGQIVEATNLRITKQANIGSPAIDLGWGTSSGSVNLTNVQFDQLSTNSAECSILFGMPDHKSVYFDHATIDLSEGSNLCFYGSLGDSSKHIAIWNSIIWDSTNSGGRIKLDHAADNLSPITLELNDVDYTDVQKLPTDVVVFNPQYPTAQFDPLWTNPAAGDYSLGAGPNSVAVNTGTVDAPGGEPPTDILGADRRIGSEPDMGAHESPYNDFAGANVFDVFNTNDVTDVNSPLYSGSLRAAMSKASTVNGPSLIQFFMPACPSVITLNSPLPLVWGPLTLNGYSSPGSWANSDATGLFNANLCVGLSSAMMATTPSALVVPSGAHDASLTVKGIGFGGFSDAIALWGGYSHQIIGNQFGGLMNGVQLFGFGLSAVRIETGGTVIVGGPSPSDRNVFQNANGWSADDSAAVLVGLFANSTQPVCQIIGNLFGITPNGFSAVPNNEYGILLEGSGCLVQGNRMAGNTKDAIYILGGSNHVIQNNVIGPAMFFGQDFSNPGAGIRIAADGANNIIGAPPGFGGSYYANDIKDMDLGGVVIGGDGLGNSVRGNRISDNGLSTGLNLDLRLDGPTANDPGDVDTGANSLMNYPKPHAFQWTNGTPIPGTFNIAANIYGLLDLAPGEYQLDAYYDDNCGAAGRGGGGWVGGGAVSIASGGVAAFDVPVTIPAYDAAHGRVSLTATSIAPGQNSTSEFSECLSVDSIFYDGFDR